MKRKKVIAAIQARMGSSRLPRKMTLPIFGKTAIEWVAYRLSFCKEVDEVVVATVDTSENDPIAAIAKRLGLPCYRGSELDLVSRLFGAATTFRADALLRVTADCPLVDPAMADEMIRAYRIASSDVHFFTNTFPPTYPDGCDLEILPAATLRELDRTVADPMRREWITANIMDHPETYRIMNLPAAEDHHDLRLTVDYPEDVELVTRIFEALHREGSVFGLPEILDLFRRQPQLSLVNRNRVDTGIVHNIRSAAFHDAKTKVAKK